VSTSSTADRRPIAQRDRAIFQAMARRLTLAGVSANTISIIGMICGIGGGAALVATAYVPAWGARLLWAAAAGLIQLRLLANMLDGMVALLTETASAVGELYNEIPDRISDSAVLVGLGYAAGSNAALGWAAALAAMMTAYVRAVGKAAGGAGARSEFCGPMAKPHRMFIVTVLAVFCAVAPTSWQAWRPAAWVLLLVVVGSIATSVRRVARIGRCLR
jgi:phosphatidylglycerophosphate synthase